MSMFKVGDVVRVVSWCPWYKVIENKTKTKHLCISRITKHYIEFKGEVGLWDPDFFEFAEEFEGNV